MRLIITFLFSSACLYQLAFGQIKADSALTKILSGDDEVTLILDFYRNHKSVSDDSLYKLLKISDTNYLLNDTKRMANPELALRHLIFSDQLLRTKCYSHKLADFSAIHKNDIELQNSFLKIVKENPDLSVLKNLTYQSTFDVLLIHSVTTLETEFFVNNFRNFSEAFSNNFKDFENLKYILDMYLKFKYEKQYFGTVAGQGRLPDGSFGQLPKMLDDDFKKVLADLKIEGAVY